MPAEPSASSPRVDDRCDLRPLGAERALDGRLRVAAVECGHAFEPRRRPRRDWPSASPRRLVGVRALQDRVHDLVFHGQGELQVGEELADVRALGRVAGAHVGVHGRARRSRNRPCRRDRRSPSRPSPDAASSRGRRSTRRRSIAFSACDSMPASDDSTSSKPSSSFAASSIMPSTMRLPSLPGSMP